MLVQRIVAMFDVYSLIFNCESSRIRLPYKIEDTHLLQKQKSSIWHWLTMSNVIVRLMIRLYSYLSAQVKYVFHQITW